MGRIPRHIRRSDALHSKLSLYDGACIHIITIGEQVEETGRNALLVRAPREKILCDGVVLYFCKDSGGIQPVGTGGVDYAEHAVKMTEEYRFVFISFTS